MEQLGLRNTNLDNCITSGLYSAALYLRFSKDDGQACDNSSIETQRMMLQKYCQDNGYKVYDIYVDDGYTGLNFDRPAFQRMLADIEAGKINMVITKDQSRLGRDYIQTGFYTEMYFTDHQVRYIAINDGADTARPENMDFMPFRNVINNMYSRDISRKVKSAKRQRALNGMFINPQAPYGYKKHPANKNQLVIDEEAAAVVREIFRLSLEGCGNTVIAKTLSAKRILVPSAYKTTQGLKGFAHFNRKGKADYEYKWSYTTVLQILRDRVYTGDMVNHKFEVLNYRTKKLVAMPKEKHIVVESTHEPLIGRDDFERVQQLITARYMPPKTTVQNIFRGLLFCSDCGKRMSLTYQTIKAKGKADYKKPMYRCKTRYTSPDECPHNNYIYADKLSEHVSAAVRKALALMTTPDTLASVLDMADKDDSRDRLNNEKSRIEKRLSTLTAVIRKLYEDYVLELLSADNYKEFLLGYQREQSELKERLTAIGKEMEGSNGFESNMRKLQALAAKYADCTALTAEMLNQLIERIEIHHPDRSLGKATQQITIIYRFIQTTL